MEGQQLVFLTLVICISFLNPILTLKVNSSSVFLRLYNKNLSQYTDQCINNVKQQDIFNAEGYDATRPSVFFSHGYIDNTDNPLSSSISEAFLSRGDYNVFNLDWRSLASPPYVSAVQMLQTVGVVLAKFLNAAVSQGLIQVSDINLIGHSLGAHLLGYTGRNLVQKPPVIVGLDPAGPEFVTNVMATKLSSKDADIVLYFLSNRGFIGTEYELGNCNYVFNPPGIVQPGCVEAICSHCRVVYYFAEAVKNPDTFNAVKCKSSNEFMNKACGKKESFIGFPVDTSCSGTYYLSTNSASPYGRGDDGKKP